MSFAMEFLDSYIQLPLGINKGGLLSFVLDKMWEAEKKHWCLHHRSIKIHCWYRQSNKELTNKGSKGLWIQLDFQLILCCFLFVLLPNINKWKITPCSLPLTLNSKERTVHAGVLKNRREWRNKNRNVFLFWWVCFTKGFYYATGGFYCWTDWSHCCQQHYQCKCNEWATNSTQ